MRWTWNGTAATFSVTEVVVLIHLRVFHFPIAWGSTVSEQQFLESPISCFQLLAWVSRLLRIHEATASFKRYSATSSLLVYGKSAWNSSKWKMVKDSQSERSHYWHANRDGNDGPWSTFNLLLGDPVKEIRFLPSFFWHDSNAHRCEQLSRWFMSVWFWTVV